MNKPSLMKQIYGKIPQFVHYKPPIRLKTNNVSSTSKFIVTEEQIQKDNFDDDAPLRPGEYDCCGQGCAKCVWYEYVIKLKYYTNNNQSKIKEALDSIPNVDVKEYVKLELEKPREKT